MRSKYKDEGSKHEMNNRRIAFYRKKLLVRERIRVVIASRGKKSNHLGKHKK